MLSTITQPWHAHCTHAHTHTDTPTQSYLLLLDQANLDMYTAHMVTQTRTQTQSCLLLLDQANHDAKSGQPIPEAKIFKVRVGTKKINRPVVQHVTRIRSTVGRMVIRVYLMFTSVRIDMNCSVQCCGTVTIFYGSGSGSYFWKVMVQVPVSVPTFEKVMVPVQVPVPTFKKLRFRFQFRFQLHI